MEDRGANLQGGRGMKGGCWMGGVVNGGLVMMMTHLRIIGGGAKSSAVNKENYLCGGIMG